MLKLSRPLHLVLATLTYALGAGIADYLGVSFVTGSFWLGLVVVLLIQLSMNLLPEVFRLDTEPLAENETRVKRQILRNNILYTSIAALASVVLILYSLFATDQLHLFSALFFSLSLAFVILYAIPPFRLVNATSNQPQPVLSFVVSPHFALSLGHEAHPHRIAH